MDVPCGCMDERNGCIDVLYGCMDERADVWMSEWMYG
jgi:hypothetical protein